MNNMPTLYPFSRMLFLLAASAWLLFAVMPASAAETPPANEIGNENVNAEESDTGADEDKKKAPPPCEYCRFETGESGLIEAGVMQVTNDNYIFARYNGLDEEGSYLLLNGIWRNITEDGRQIDIALHDAGLENRQLNTRYARQGSYAFSAAYAATPQAGYPGAQTPFIRQNGYDNVLRLPGNWIDGSTTRTMPGLDNALRNTELENLRRRTMAAMEFGMLRNWDFDIEFNHEERDGTGIRGGSFLTSASQLPVPRDYITDTMDASVFYNGESLTMRFAYYLSLFSTTHDGISWENPYQPLAPGMEMGYLAVEPDNRFHQLSASLAYRMSPKTVLHVQAAIGTGTQDNAYLPATANVQLGPVSLPSADLDGKVETRTLHARLNSRVNSSLSFQANIRSDERDNQSPEFAYTQIVTDTYLADDKLNRSYDITRKNYDISANYRPSSDFRLRAAIEKKDAIRNYMEVDRTSENIAWIDTTVSPLDFASLRVKYLQSDRDGSSVIYDQPGGLEQNPLLRRFHVANRNRESWQLAVDLDPLPWMFITLAAEIDEDEYPDSDIGLRRSTVRTQSLDANFVASPSMRYALFVNHDKERNRQAGSEGFSQPDWFATSNDMTWTFGFGANYEDIEKPWTLRLNLSVSEFAGESDVNTYTDVPAFPALVAQMYHADLGFSYRLSKNRQLMIGYVYEEYDARNWQLEAAQPASVPSLLSAGIYSPNYHVSVLSLSYRWGF